MKYSEQVIVKRWIPILKEYEKTKAKVTPRQFKFIKDLCEAHHISRKELRHYYRKWSDGGKKPEALLPAKRGARPGSRRTPKFKGSMEREHPFEMMCVEIGIKHKYTRPYRPQTNGKIEAFWKILKNEFFYPNTFDSKEDIILNLGNFLFEYNHLRAHGGLEYKTPFDKLECVTELLS